MIFVDGSNLLVQLYDSVVATQRAESPGKHAFTLAAHVIKAALNRFTGMNNVVSLEILRRYWFGSVQGSPEYLNSRRTMLRELGYEPVLFQKMKGRAEKGVDLAVARDVDSRVLSELSARNPCGR